MNAHNSSDPARRQISLPLDQVIQGDCLEVLERLPESCIDLVFADPPYNLQLKQELWRPNLTKVDAVDDEWDRFDSFAEYDAFTRKWLSACRRILKDTGTLWVIGTYHNIHRVGAILQDLDYWILNEVAWIKTNPMPNFRGVRFTNAHETLIWAQKKRGSHYTFNHQAMKALNDDLQMRSDWYLPLCTGKERIKINGVKVHPTQKPEALLYRVIMSSTHPGDVVVDPFFGTGTSGAVAKKLRRHWIGIERDESYVKVAQERLDSIQPGPGTEDAFLSAQPRKLQRVPFGFLLECGLLQPGQMLYFQNNAEQAAVILEDGRLRFGDLAGSIHFVAKVVLNAPCNGWEYWYYEDKNGNRVKIDALRQQAREKIENQTDALPSP